MHDPHTPPRENDSPLVILALLAACAFIAGLIVLMRGAG